MRGNEALFECHRCEASACGKKNVVHPERDAKKYLGCNIVETFLVLTNAASIDACSVQQRARRSRKHFRDRRRRKRCLTLELVSGPQLGCSPRGGEIGQSEVSPTTLALFKHISQTHLYSFVKGFDEIDRKKYDMLPFVPQ